MLQFLDPKTDLSTAMPGSYDALLVTVSYLVAVLGSYAGLTMSDRAGALIGYRRHWLWVVGGSVVMGIGIWAMHFIGMLAFSLPVPVAYDFILTALSIAPAVLACGLALCLIVSKQKSHSRYVIGGALIGAGIGAMHYIGMAGMRVNALMLFGPEWFAVSIVVAIVLGIVALYVHDLKVAILGHLGLYWVRPFGAAIMGLAITGMHYTAMAGVYFFPASTGSVGPFLVRSWLDDFMVIIVITVATIAIATAVVERRMQLEAQRTQAIQQRMVDVTESQIRVNAIVNTVVDGIITIDDKGMVDTFNPAAARIFGYDAEEVVGQNVKMLMPEPYHGEHGVYLDNGYLFFQLTPLPEENTASYPLVKSSPFAKLAFASLWWIISTSSTGMPYCLACSTIALRKLLE